MTRISLNHCNRAPAFNRVRDLVAEGYVGKVLSCTMIITTPAWGTEFTLDWAYMADRSNGNTLLSRVRESRPHGSGRGAVSNDRPLYVVSVRRMIISAGWRGKR